MRGGGFRNTYIADLDFPGGSVVKNLPVDAGDARDAGLIPGSGTSPGIKKWQPTSVSCLENSRQEEPDGLYSAWGHKELDTTEHTHTHHKMLLTYEVCSVALYF